MRTSPEARPATLDELRRIPILRELPDSILQWILDRSEVMEHDDRERLTKTGDPIDHLWLLIEGEVEFHQDVGGRLIRYLNFDHNPPALGAGGLIPYSRMKSSPGVSFAKGRVRSIRLHRSHFRELEQLSPELVQRLVGTMTERARLFAIRQLQEEKINALGKLAAGIAHELNNPAAAIQRTVTELAKRLSRNYDLTGGLLESGISGDEVRRVHEVVSRPVERTGVPLSLMERMGLEDELVERLRELEVQEPESLAEVLAEAGIDLERLEGIRRTLPDERFRPLMRWLCNLLVASKVIREVEDASSRISALVGSIKSHVHLDRSTARQPVDVHRGIEDTLAILGHKVREKRIELIRDYGRDAPNAFGHPGELNQVWTNLIDNAVDALGEGGQLRITTARRGDQLQVCIQDNGPGIPPEIRNQIFDPFFTTKKQGQGTGIGLDIVRQTVERHGGEIRVHSEPGRTEFQIYLPAAEVEGAGAASGAEAS